MDAALGSLKQLSATADRVVRHQLMNSLLELAYSLEDSDDTVNRIGNLHLQTAGARIGFDLGLFEHLVETGGPVTVEQFAQKTSAEPRFLRRWLRYLASIGTIKETGKDAFVANNVSKNLAEKFTAAGVSHYFETTGPYYQELPKFLRKHGYKSPTDEEHTVHQDAWSWTGHVFAWFTENPDKLRFFNDYLALRRARGLSWLAAYPVAEEARGWDGSRAAFVDIGGGIGHQCADFKKKHPDMPGRVVLQDLPHTIDAALATPGVDNTVHNFFEPQPVKGAKFYYARAVAHNHPDARVQLLLEQTKAAMAADSVVLLDEMVLPEAGVSSYAAAMDLTMMAACAAMERTEAHWRELLAGAGLRLVKVYTYNPASYESVLDVRLA